jgi:hypothetical protein
MPVSCRFMVMAMAMAGCCMVYEILGLVSSVSTPNPTQSRLVQIVPSHAKRGKGAVPASFFQ